MELIGRIASKPVPDYYKIKKEADHEFLLEVGNQNIPILFSSYNCPPKLLRLGEDVVVTIEIKVTDWNGKRFINLLATKIEFDSIDHPACLDNEFDWCRDQPKEEYARNDSEISPF